MNKEEIIEYLQEIIKDLSKQIYFKNGQTSLDYSILISHRHGYNYILKLLIKNEHIKEANDIIKELERFKLGLNYEINEMERTVSNDNFDPNKMRLLLSTLSATEVTIKILLNFENPT